MNKEYFGGTNITLDRLKEIYKKHSMDGTEVPIEKYIKELSIIDNLIAGKSKVWIPYGVNNYGILNHVEWDKHEYKHYYITEETKDWWIMDVCMMVDYFNQDGSINQYCVYEYTFYNKEKVRNWMRRGFKSKGKFLSKKAISEIKKGEAIQNSIYKRIN